MILDSSNVVETLIYPAPYSPNPFPGVTTIPASSKSLDAKAFDVRPFIVSNQT